VAPATKVTLFEADTHPREPVEYLAALGDSLARRSSEATAFIAEQREEPDSRPAQRTWDVEISGDIQWCEDHT